MLTLYQSQHELARGLNSDVAYLTHLSAILRSLLQCAALCAIEIVPSLVDSLTEWVRFRNHHLWHEVVDAPNADVWSHKTDALISRLLNLERPLNIGVILDSKLHSDSQGEFMPL